MEGLKHYPHCSKEGMIGTLVLIKKGELDRVDGTVLFQRGLVSKGNAYKVVGALKFLGFISRQGEFTIDGHLLRDQMYYIPTLQRGIERSYGARLVRNFIKSGGSLEIAQDYFIRAGMSLSTSKRAARVFGGIVGEAEMLDQPQRRERKLSAEAIVQAMVEDHTLTPEQIASIIVRARGIDNIPYPRTHIN